MKTQTFTPNSIKKNKRKLLKEKCIYKIFIVIFKPDENEIDNCVYNVLLLYLVIYNYLSFKKRIYRCN